MNSLLQTAGQHARAYWLSAEQRAGASARVAPRHRAVKHRLAGPVDSPSRSVPTYGGRHRAGAAA